MNADATDRRRETIEHAVRSRAGMSPEARQRMHADMELHSDWTARCQKCGESLRGSVAELKAHTCGDGANG